MRTGLGRARCGRPAHPVHATSRACPSPRRTGRRSATTASAVWLLYPDPADASPELHSYLAVGIQRRVPEAYKCQIRDPWWRPPMVSPPDLFFTYMSHRYPRLVSNDASVTFVNSMHGVRLRASRLKGRKARAAASSAQLGYDARRRGSRPLVRRRHPQDGAPGGCQLPGPGAGGLAAAWERLKDERAALDRQLRNGLWTNVVKRVDEVLLRRSSASPARKRLNSMKPHAFRERRLAREDGPGRCPLRHRGRTAAWVGHPGDSWDALIPGSCREAVTRFAQVKRNGWSSCGPWTPTGSQVAAHGTWDPARTSAPGWLPSTAERATGSPPSWSRCWRSAPRSASPRSAIVRLLSDASGRSRVACAKSGPACLRGDESDGRARLRARGPAARCPT